MTTQLERIARLEKSVQIIEDQQKEILDKLEELLTLKNKGVGAFWLASTVVGTSIVGFVYSVLSWLKGVHL